MKTRNFIIAIAAFVALSSCKDEKGKAAEPEKPAVKQNFNVEMDVVADVKDDFALYFTENGTNAFTPTQVAWKGVNGGNVDEKLVIELPEEVVPTNIRLDFGIKKERKDVVLKKLKINFFDKSFDIMGADFFKYFIANPNLPSEVNAQDLSIKFIRNPKSEEGTFFYPRQELLDEIAKLTK